MDNTFSTLNVLNHLLVSAGMGVISYVMALIALGPSGHDFVPDLSDPSYLVAIVLALVVFAAVFIRLMCSRSTAAEEWDRLGSGEWDN